MKYNINKFQSGGAVIQSPYIYNTPIERAVPSATSTGAKQDTSSSFDMNDIAKQLASKGALTSDIIKFTEELSKIDMSPSFLLDSGNTTKAIRMIAKVKEIENNSEMWKDSVKASRENGSYGEVAVSDSGNIFYKDPTSGNIKEGLISNYKKDPNKYGQLLSVADLLQERQKNSNLAFDQNIFNIADSSVGLQKITDHIQKLFTTLSDYSDVSEQHLSREAVQEKLDQRERVIKMAGRKPTKEELSGIVELKSILETPGEYMKIEQKVSGKGKNIKSAYNYIIATLGDPARRKLKVSAALNNTTEEGIIGGMLTNYSAPSEELKVTGETLPGESKSKADALTNSSKDELFLSGKLNVQESFNWNDPNTGKTMLFPTTGRQTVMVGDRPFGLGTFSQLASTNFSQYLDIAKATFGGNPIGLSDKDKIVTEGELYRMYIPTNNDGTPNLNLLKKLQDAQIEVEKHPEWTPEKINNFYIDRGLNYVQVDENKQFITQANLKPYAVTWGYTTDQANVTSDNNNIQKLSSEEENQIDKALSPIYKQAKVNVPTGWFGTYGTDYYKGITIIPIKDDASAIAAANKGNVFTPKIQIGDIQENMETQVMGRYIPMQGSSQLLNEK